MQNWARDSDILGDFAPEPGESYPNLLSFWGELGTYSLVGMSAIGLSHQQLQTPRQDAVNARLGSNWILIAVADGIGSHDHAHLGASFAVWDVNHNLYHKVSAIPQRPFTPDDRSVQERATSEGFIEVRPKTTKEPTAAPPVEEVRLREVGKWQEPAHYPTTFHGTLRWYPKNEGAIESFQGPVRPLSRDEIIDAFASTRSHLEQYANLHNRNRLDEEVPGESKGYGLDTMGCTLLLLAFHPLTGYATVAQLGDGMIAARTRDGGFLRLVEPKYPPEAEGSSASYCLSDSNWQREVVIEQYSPEETLEWSDVFLMTDGLSNNIIEAETRRQWVGTIAKRLRDGNSHPSQQSVSLLHWIANIRIPGNFDDRTLAVLSHQPTLIP